MLQLLNSVENQACVEDAGAPLKLLNVGCGTRFHWAWTNLDLVSGLAGVIEHDLRSGLPFDDGAYDAVYHSHVLEHLNPDDGRALLAECLRVLKPGGTLRVVAPDLERAARGYLAALDRAAQSPHEASAHSDYEWMTIELLDQMVRVKSGGEMLRYVNNPALANPAFVRERIGDELLAPRQASRRPPWLKRKLARLAGKLRRWLALGVVLALVGRRACSGLREGLFRQSGEVHRWMYDRLSLERALYDVGFDEVWTAGAEESRIPDFAGYELDAVAGKVRKPESLFMEATKAG